MPATFRPRGSAFCTHSVRGRFRGGSPGETLEVAGPGAGFAALPGLEGRAAGQAHGLAKRLASVRANARRTQCRIAMTHTNTTAASSTTAAT